MIASAQVDGKAVIPVKFHNQVLFWLKDADGSGVLAPREHLDDAGHIRSAQVAFFEDSYAHVFEDGRIMRYGEVIGTVEDLEFVPAPEDMRL